MDRFKTDDPNEPVADYIEQAVGALEGNNIPRAIELVLKELRRREPKEEPAAEPLELLIICPLCKVQHIDEGRFATHAHKNHACQNCGLVFQPCKLPSIGVQFFTGYKNPK